MSGSLNVFIPKLYCWPDFWFIILFSFVKTLADGNLLLNSLFLNGRVLLPHMHTKKRKRKLLGY